MKQIYKASTGYLIAIVLIGGVSGVYGYHSLQSATPHDYVLSRDNFSKQTMDGIELYGVLRASNEIKEALSDRIVTGNAS